MKKMEKKINVVVSFGAMELLQGKANIDEAVAAAIGGTDEAFDTLATYVSKNISDDAIAAEAEEAISDVLDEQQLIRHTKILRDEIKPDYAEMSGMADRGEVAFRVPCVVDVIGVLGEILPPEKVEAVTAE